MEEEGRPTIGSSSLPTEVEKRLNSKTIRLIVFGAVLDKVSQGEITTGDDAWAQAMDLLHQLVPESN